MTRATKWVYVDTGYLILDEGVRVGVAWFLKICTDPFHDICIYHKASYHLLKGEIYDDMSEW